MHAIFIYLIIFIVKVIEVTISTLRIVLITKDHRIKGAFLAFFEVSIWLIVVSLGAPWQQ